MYVLTLKHVHVASTQGHFGKEAKRNELAFLLSNDDKIKCFTADRKTVSHPSLQSFWYVCPIQNCLWSTAIYSSGWDSFG